MAVVDCVFTGDLILDEPDPDHWLGGIAPAVGAADVAVGHLEVPHTDRCDESGDDVPAPAAPAAHLAALSRAGFAAVTLAGNHIADCGARGIEDTCIGLDRLGIAACGAGADIVAARRPALLTRHGLRLGILSYNCVGPESGWATAARAGCAFVRVVTANEVPITPADDAGSADPRSIAAMQEDIAAVSVRSDIVVVALHKGIVHTPARLANYEAPIAHAAVDAGADVVVGHHAHIVRGIEFYRDRPIFHGLGNGCVVTRALSGGGGNARRAEWAQRRKRRFGFEPDPAYSLAPFHPEAVHSMLARVRVHRDGRLEAGFSPVWVDPPGRPRIAEGAQAAEVAAYIARITATAGLAPLVLHADSGGIWVRR